MACSHGGHARSTQSCFEGDPGEPGTFNWGRTLSSALQLDGLGVGCSGAWFFLLLQVADLPPGLLGLHLHQAPWGPECIRPKTHRHPYCAHVMGGKTQALSWTLGGTDVDAVYFSHPPSCLAAWESTPFLQGPHLSGHLVTRKEGRIRGLGAP